MKYLLRVVLAEGDEGLLQGSELGHRHLSLQEAEDPVEVESLLLKGNFEDEGLLLDEVDDKDALIMANGGSLEVGRNEVLDGPETEAG